ncbi:MAG: LCP family protein [Oscillospiraceae bacterium]|nr:LCP family protein [Oscillospiraceae bacterium]
MDQNTFPEEVTGAPLQRKRKRSKKMGVTAFILTFTALLLLAAMGVYGFLRYRSKTLAGTDISIFSVMITVGAILAGVGFILGVVTLFLKKQRKGFAVSAILIALVVLLICVGAMYVYQYIFSDLNHDSIFSSLNDEDLNIVKINNGEVIRDATPENTENPDDLEAQAKQMEIEFENLTNEDLPPEALAKMHSGDPEGPSYLLDGADQITNFMLFGLDKVGSSDSNIILSVDRVHHKIKLISIGRDSYVMMPQWGSYSRITYAYNFGGPQGAIRTVNHNFALNIQDYISVDFDQMIGIVNLLGGIDVELSGDDVWKYNSHMNGDQALRYSRDRSDSEINRAARQRNVVRAMMDKVRQMPLADYPSFIRSCFGMCTTSFGTDELLGLCLEVVQNSYTVESSAVMEHMDCWAGVLGKEEYVYFVYDLNRASDWIYRTIYEDLYVSGYADPQKAEQKIPAGVNVIGQAMYGGLLYDVPEVTTGIAIDEGEELEDGVAITQPRTPLHDLECNVPGRIIQFAKVGGSLILLVDGKQYLLK